MTITTKHPIPTGYLFTGEYSKGQLEALSIGDYGKHHNVKADFLGYTREIEGVPNTSCMPLSEKWVITLSTQYGCPMKCSFCDVPNIPFRGNASFDDLQNQFFDALSLFPNVRYTERLNIHFARMGEPIFNENVFKFATWLADNKPYIQIKANLRIEVIHPVLTTSCPKNFDRFEERLNWWSGIKNDHFNGQAGLQLSINSTSDEQRDKMFRGMQMSLEDIASVVKYLPPPISRKYCLNFAYSTDFEIDADRLRYYFDPNKFMCKITPIHNNNACRSNNIATVGGYESYHPYRQVEKDLKDAGFDVLVFVPSIDEEDGLVTCGNLITGGGKLKTTTDVINIEGQ
jgi:23S rRNA (adenine2503-C2)-methyltransferase